MMQLISKKFIVHETVCTNTHNKCGSLGLRDGALTSALELNEEST